jgi:hypothetical protein
MLFLQLRRKPHDVEPYRNGCATGARSFVDDG